MGRLGFWGKGVGVMVVCLACTVAQAERRVALVIGNANYVQEKKRLANPVNDAQDMYAKLQTLGFAKADIVYREDLKQRDIDATLAEFEKKLGGDTVALVYYAGHGLALNLDGDKNFQNYLPAVDAKIDDKLQVARQSIAVGDLIRLLRRGKSRVNLVFLDACRDNPFNRSLRGEAVRGMAKENPPVGTWIAYATRPGEVAEDGAGRRNGLFTERLLAHIDTPGITLDDMFRRVANDVVERTKEGQEPWPEGWLSKAFYMVPRAVQPPPPPPPPPGPRVGEVIKDCTDCPELVLLPKGSFVMGSPDSEKDRDGDEGPTRTVTISKAIAVGRYEVTRAEFGRFVAESQYKTEAERGNGCAAWDGSAWKYDTARNWRDPGFRQGEDHPVVCVSWNDTQEYLKWLNQKAPAKNFRLLSEAEWEYAARAGRGATRFPWGDDLDYTKMCAFANGADETAKAQVPGTSGWTFSKCSDGYAYTAPVTALQPNAFGLMHMHGNAWEWVQDVWHENYTGAPTDGSAWESGGDSSRRVLRGGSWYDYPRSLRSANRDGNTPVIRSGISGFRIARTF